MLQICPNYKNREVFDKFNEMIEILGGRPMTEEEFKSSELRAQRTGLDYSAMEAAYRLYKMNNGNFLDVAPNGQPSILYKTFYDLYGGDRRQALIAKSNTYSKMFIDWFGDWTTNDENSSKVVDENGEPTIVNDGEQNFFVSKDGNTISLYTHKDTKPNADKIISKKFSRSDTLHTFGPEIGERLISGDRVSSNEIVQYMIQNQLFSDNNNQLSQILSVHDIPVMFSTTISDEMMETITDEYGQSVIVINPEIVGKASNKLIADTLLHEIVHALTVPAINEPQTTEERNLANDNHKLFSFMDKLFPTDVYNRLDRTNGMYALTNEKEFVAEFITNKNVRDLVYKTARQLDQKDKNTIKQRIKNFINSIIRFLLNREVFLSNEELVRQYEHELKRLLFNAKPINSTQYKNSQLIDILNNSIDGIAVENDNAILFRKDFAFQVENFERNFAIESIVVGRDYNEEEVKRAFKDTSKKIATQLAQRLAAIKNSNLPEEYKITQSQLLSSQIQQFKSDTITEFEMFSTFMSQLLPQLLTDCRKLRKIHEGNLTTTDTEYMYQAHDNFGTYEQIVSTMGEMFKKNSFLDYLSRQIPEKEIDKTNLFMKDMDTLRNAINQVTGLVKDGQTYCNSLLLRNIKQRLQEVGEKVNSAEIEDYLEQLKSIGYDTSKWFLYAGSIDKAQDLALRTINHLVTEAIETAEELSQKRNTKLLKLQDQLKVGESVKDLYEYNKKGLTTGYLVRKLNYGQFFEDYNDFLSGLNVSYGLASDNRVQPEGELGVKWNMARNKWLSDHCHRRFLPKYYEMYAGLSQITRNRREELQSEIRLLKEKAFDKKDGYYHYERLTDAEYNRLQDLYIQKRILKSDIDINGNKKTGTELQIARELQELDKNLGSFSKNKFERDIEAFENARNAIFKECGGKEEYDKGEEGNFDFKKYKKWLDRNCEAHLKVDEDGVPLLMKKIYSEMEDIPVYEVDGDGGSTYESLKAEFNEILNTRRDFYTGDVLATKIPETVSTKLQSLQKQMDAIKKKAKAQNKELAKHTKQFRKLFNKYAKSEPSQLYKQLEREAIRGGYLEQFRKATGRYVFDEFSGDFDFVPNKWFTKIMPQKEYMDDFFEYVPGKGWTEPDENNEFLNTKFDESEGMTMVPLKSLYDNSAKYNKIFDENGKPKGALGQLYKEVFNTLQEVNEIYHNKTFHDNYLLPQIPGSIFKRTRNKSIRGKFEALRDYAKESFGLSDTRSFDIEYGQSVEQILNRYDDFGEIISNTDDIFGEESVVGRRPDGRDLHMIPRYYVNKLHDPSQISSDLCGITGEYYRQAIIYKNKNKIVDACESMVDMIEHRDVEKREAQYETNDVVDPDTGKVIKKTSTTQKTNSSKGDRSVTYQVARDFLNTQLYNMKTDAYSIRIGHKTWKVGKVAVLWKMLTTAVNLGCNIAVAGTGFITAMAAHTVQALVGHRYSFKSSFAGTVEQIWQLIKSFGGATNIGNKVSTNKMTVLAENFNIANQNTRKTKHTNRNRLLNAISDNWCFGYLSGCDYLVKTNVMLSVLMDYRMYNGRFITEQQLRYEMWNKSKEELNSAIKQFKSGKCLYDVLNTDDGTVKVEIGYEQAYNAVKDKIHSSITKWAEDADGMPTETQKAAMATNIIGAAILTHRQYLPLMLQHRFGQMYYDFDTQMYEGGVFRSFGSMFKMLYMPFIKDATNLQVEISKEAARESRKYAAIMGASLGLTIDTMFINSPLGLLGMLTGAGLSYLNASVSTTYQKRFANKFANKTSREEYEKSTTRKHHLKQVAIELVAYHLFIQPIINAICAFADDDDDDKDKIAFAVVQYLASLIEVDSESNTVQLLAFLGRRFQWEFFTPYRAEDLINNIKSPSAQIGPFDFAESLGKQMYRSIFPRETLLDTLLSMFQDNDESDDDDDYDYYVNNGLYSESELKEYFTDDSRFPKWFKAAMKLIPLHHTYEQIFDSKRKREYYENQIMQLDK